MLGKILLILLGVVLLALLILLLLPVSCRLTYENGELRAWIRYAGVRIMQYPDESKEEKPPKKKKKSGRKKTKPNWDQVIYSLDVLPKVLIKALSYTVGRISITPLKLHVLVAGSDPADTAVLYGKIYGAFSAVLPALHRAVKVREQDIQLFPDFSQEHMDLIADAGIRIRLWDIIVFVMIAAVGLIKWYKGFKKRASKDDSAANKQTKKSAGAERAA